MKFRWVTMVLLLSCASVLAAKPAAKGQGEPVKVLIAFDSRTGNTEALARAVLDGVDSVEGVDGNMKRVSEVSRAEILSADGFLIGTPVHWTNVSSVAKSFIDRIGEVLVEAKELGPGSSPELRSGGAFVTGGSVSSGKELTRLAILSAFINMKLIVVGAEDDDGFGTLGPQATTGPSDPGLSDAELEEARRFGVRFAAVTKQLVD